MEKAAFDSGEWEIYEANLRPSLGPQKQDSENRNLEPMRCTHTCVCVCVCACVHVGMSMLGKEWVGLLWSEREPK